jgi:hypothetical protein
MMKIVKFREAVLTLLMRKMKMNRMTSNLRGRRMKKKTTIRNTLGD